MLKKILLVSLILVSGCGYTAVYNNSNSANYNITISKMTGDRYMNNLIKNEFEIHSNKNSENIYVIELNTSYTKTIKTKNVSGVASNYEIIVISTFNVNSKTISFEEKFIVKNMSDSLEQRNYENIIKENFASLIREKLVMKLMNL